MESPGVLKKKMWKFQDQLKKKQNFEGCSSKNSCGISMGLAF